MCMLLVRRERGQGGDAAARNTAACGFAEQQASQTSGDPHARGLVLATCVSGAPAPDTTCLRRRCVTAGASDSRPPEEGTLRRSPAATPGPTSTAKQASLLSRPTE